MEFPWDSSSLPHNAHDPVMNLLTEPFQPLELDDKTLQLLGGPSTSALAAAASLGAQGSEAGPSNCHKRARDDDWLAGNWLAAGSDDADVDAGGRQDEDDSGDECLDRKGKRIGKKGKPMSQAALAKASREKMRRERLNDCLDELARLCDPSGKMVKTDRVSIVTDAIRSLSQLRVENNQLRQLNKFLEERVSTYERQRAETMYQRMMMEQMQQQQQAQQLAQQQQQQHVPAAQLGAVPSGEFQSQSSAALPPALIPAPAPGQAQTVLPTPPVPGSGDLAALQASTPLHAPAAQLPEHHLPAAAAAPAPPVPQLVASPPAASQVQPMPAPQQQPPSGLAPATTVAFLGAPAGAALGTAAQFMAVKQEQLGGVGMQPLIMPLGVMHSLPQGAPPVGWFPAASLDASQDQKLRPPAA